MGCDLVTALSAATVTGHTLLGVNYFGLGSDQGGLCVLSSKVHSPGENVVHPPVQIPEVRHTSRVLGWQTPGFLGPAVWRQRTSTCGGIQQLEKPVCNNAKWSRRPRFGALTLERAASARQGLEVLCEMIERHGQSATQADHIFLLADPREAFVVEATGSHWAVLECQQTRAVCDVALSAKIGSAFAAWPSRLWTRDGGQRMAQRSTSMRRFPIPKTHRPRASSAGAKRRWRCAARRRDRSLLPKAYASGAFRQLPRIAASPSHLARNANRELESRCMPSLVWTAPGHLGRRCFSRSSPACRFRGYGSRACRHSTVYGIGKIGDARCPRSIAGDLRPRCRIVPSRILTDVQAPRSRDDGTSRRLILKRMPVHARRRRNQVPFSSRRDVCVYFRVIYFPHNATVPEELCASHHVKSCPIPHLPLKRPAGTGWHLKNRDQFCSSCHGHRRSNLASEFLLLDTFEKMERNLRLLSGHEFIAMQQLPSALYGRL